jgi:isopenicillin-N epimerase
MLCEAWSVEPISPADESMIGSMATVPLPVALGGLDEAGVTRLQKRLYEQHRVEAPLMRWGGNTYVRPCSQVYNVPEDYQRLAAAMTQLAQDVSRTT